MQDRTPTPFEAYVAPARPKAELWRTAVGLCLIAIIYIAFLVMFTQATYRFWDTRAPTPLGTLLLLFSFGGMAMGVVVVATGLHKRAAPTLFGPIQQLVSDFMTVCGAVAMIYALTLVFWSFEYDAAPELTLSAWLLILTISLLGVLIQTGAEELVFRGYLQQQLAARFRSRLIWIGASPWKVSPQPRASVSLPGACPIWSSRNGNIHPARSRQYQANHQWRVEPSNDCGGNGAVSPIA